jgi:hypothetical protein
MSIVPFPSTYQSAREVENEFDQYPDGHRSNCARQLISNKSWKQKVTNHGAISLDAVGIAKAHCIPLVYLFKATDEGCATNLNVNSRSRRPHAMWLGIMFTLAYEKYLRPKRKGS